MCTRRPCPSSWRRRKNDDVWLRGPWGEFGQGPATASPRSLLSKSLQSAARTIRDQQMSDASKPQAAWRSAQAKRGDEADLAGTRFTRPLYDPVAAVMSYKAGANARLVNIELHRAVVAAFFNRIDWQSCLDFFMLTRFITSKVFKGFSRRAIRIFSRSVIGILSKRVNIHRCGAIVLSFFAKMSFQLSLYLLWIPASDPRP